MEQAMILTLVPSTASAIIAGLAASISAWNASKTARNAERQYRLSYLQDVAKWSLDVVKIYHEARLIRMDNLSAETLKTEFRRLAINAGVAREAGKILFTHSENAALNEVRTLLTLLETDYLEALPGFGKVDPQNYIDGLHTFTELARSSTGADVRFDKK